MNNQDFQELCREIEDKIRLEFEMGENIAYKINNRMTRASGRCTRVGEDAYLIEISKYILDKDTLEDIIAHEIIHTMYGCMNHGFKFKAKMNQINMMFGYNISVYANESANVNYKHEVKCNTCGKISGRQRMCGIVKYPDSYICGTCGGHGFTRIK